MSDQITFEHPLNEKSRTLLRLSHLFEQLKHHLTLDNEWESRAVVLTLINIVSILARSDIKSELIKQLKNYDQYLSSISNKQGVDKSRLEQILNELSVTRHSILEIDGQLGQRIRSNEFLNSIVQRSGIPGGAFDFDLPEYHFWLNQSQEKRMEHLNDWRNELTPIQQAVDLLLAMIRNSAPAQKQHAVNGFYQQSLGAYTSAQLIRVTLLKSEDLFAEISGGKHRFSIRFRQSNFNGQAQQSEQNLTFKLAICAI